MPTLCIKSLSNGISAAILFIPFYLSCSKFLLDFFLGKCYISKCPCSSVDRVPGYEPVGRRFESRQARQHDTLRFAVRVCFYVYIYGNTDLGCFRRKKPINPSLFSAKTRFIQCIPKETLI